ncbi:MAG: hemerythrin domain-containing protein [Chitinophagales bacterium]|nr:hemerythrin domain-containing protein [Chitinophagales bacterium]MDW8427279.1 hemerythrin domain-containing protein [Chitinophagales bacterium]
MRIDYSATSFALQTPFYGHRALMRDLSLLQQQIINLDKYRKAELKALHQWFRHFRSLLDKHHQAEDHFLFQELERRIGLPSEEIEAIETEHQHLQFLLDEMDGLLLRALTQAAADVQPLLQERMILLAQQFHQHIKHEEELICQMVEKQVSHSEQLRLDRRLRQRAPLSYQALFVPWVHDVLSDSERRLLYERVPWYVRLWVRVCTQRRHQRRWQAIQQPLTSAA